MVRSKTHKMVRFQGIERGQLFDLEQDPGEVNDLWGDPGYAQVRSELLEVLTNWHIDSAVATKNARRRIVSPSGPDSIQDGGG